MKKWVYLFNEVKEVEKLAGGSWDGVKSIVGGKGAGLLDMTRAGVPVPPFFTVTTEACNAYQAGAKFPCRYVGPGIEGAQGHRKGNRQKVR